MNLSEIIYSCLREVGELVRVHTILFTRGRGTCESTYNPVYGR